MRVYVLLIVFAGTLLSSSPCAWASSVGQTITPESDVAKGTPVLDAFTLNNAVMDEEEHEGAFVADYVPYFGNASLKERIAKAEVIARVSLRSITDSTVWIDIPDSVRSSEFYDGYVRAVIFEYNVLEYLKGSGSAEVNAVVFDVYRSYATST